MEKATYNFEVMGQKLSLRSDGDPEIVQEALRIASLKLGDAQKRCKGAAPFQAALVALLDLAEDYVRAKRKASDHRKRLDDKVTRVLELMDQELR